MEYLLHPQTDGHDVVVPRVPPVYTQPLKDFLEGRIESEFDIHAEMSIFDDPRAPDRDVFRFYNEDLARISALLRDFEDRMHR